MGNIFLKQNRKKNKKRKACSFILSFCLTKRFFSNVQRKKLFKKNRKMSVDAVFKEVSSFISDKNKFVGPTRSNILPWEVCPRTDFLALFEKAAGMCIVAGHTPNFRGINIYIERASQNNIGRLRVSKNFWRKKSIFFGPRFFSLFHPKFSCGRTCIFFQNKK